MDKVSLCFRRIALYRIDRGGRRALPNIISSNITGRKRSKLKLKHEPWSTSLGMVGISFSYKEVPTIQDIALPA